MPKRNARGLEPEKTGREFSRQVEERQMTALLSSFIENILEGGGLF